MANRNWKPWWVLFPLSGLAVSDSRHDLNDKALFGDATIVAPKHIERIAHLLGYRKRAVAGNATKAQWVEGMRLLPGGEVANSFLAVRCIANMSEDKHKVRALTHARKRANQIAAALCMIQLAQSAPALACGLVEQRNWGATSYGMIDMRDKMYGRGMAAKLTPFYYTDNPIKRATIRKMYLRQHRTRWLANALICRQPALRPDLEDIITTATLRLSEAVHTLNGSARVIGAVTSTEVLLTHDTGSSNFDLLLQRVKTLLGSEISNRYQLEDVFKARHRVVHRGEEITDETTQLLAVALALACLLRYAEVAQHFLHKTAILDYLDWHAKADSVAENLVPAEVKAFDRALKSRYKHYRGGPPFTWAIRR